MNVDEVALNTSWALVSLSLNCTHAADGRMSRFRRDPQVLRWSQFFFARRSERRQRSALPAFTQPREKTGATKATCHRNRVLGGVTDDATMERRMVRRSRRLCLLVVLASVGYTFCRNVRDSLERRSGVEGTKRRQRVLILCTGNSCRSQMAEAVWRTLGGANWEVFSAGTHPKGVDPRTLTVLKERGYPTEGLRSKSVTEFAGQEFDVVVTVCEGAREACPTWPGAGTQVHWSVPDPADACGTMQEQLDEFRRVLGMIEEKVSEFLREEVSSQGGPRNAF